MKIYVATQYENKKNAQKLMKRLRSSGHSITHDWTKESQAIGPKPSPETEEEASKWQAYAQLDAAGVAAADVLVVLTVKEGGRGMYSELGIAIPLRIPTIVVGPHYNNIFYFMPNCVRVDNVEDALDLVKDIKKSKEILNKNNIKEKWPLGV